MGYNDVAINVEIKRASHMTGVIANRIWYVQKNRGHYYKESWRLKIYFPVYFNYSIESIEGENYFFVCLLT